MSGNQALEEKKDQVDSAANEIEELHQAWVSHREEMDAELRRVKRIFEEKRSEVVAKEEKIDFYEENYGNLIAEYKKEVQKREYYIQEYQAMPKDMTREELSKMIFDIKKRAKQNESTTIDRVDELKNVEGKNLNS